MGDVGRPEGADDDERTVAEATAAMHAAERPTPARGDEPSAHATSIPLPIGEVIRARLRRGEEGGRIGRYHILRLLGEGGMGLVFAAYDEDLDRKVAIKLLRTDTPSGRLDRAWLLSEAKAMARLSHPNVVQIYDIGEIEDQVFVAMELVVGVSLRDWLRQSNRSVAEILRVFTAAGRGLQAVHEAGLIHRDFKPQNVLVAPDGRARVLDFGLAHRRRDAAAAPPDPEVSSVTGSHRSLAAQPAASTSARGSTQTVAGTPAYMAPEQHQGVDIDARADIFAFSVALYEALFHRRPFAGKSAREIVQSMLAGEMAPPPPDSRVPAWIRRAVTRGLALSPADRWPSMAALLEALGRDPWRIRLRVLAAIGVFAVIGGAVATAHHYRALAAEQEANVCAGSEARLAGVWDGERRVAARDAFLASGRPFAADTWTRVEARLDAYAAEWIAADRAACQDHRAGALSAGLHERAIACVEGARRDLDALTRAYAITDPTIVEKAIKAVERLPRLAQCGDRSALAAQVLPPDATIAAPVEAIRGALAGLRAEVLLSRTDRCGEADALLQQAVELAYRPLIAEVHWVQGSCVEIAGDYDAAARAMRAAVLTAVGAAHDAVAIDASTRLGYVVGYRQAHYAEGRSWSEIARALIDRSSGRDEVRARVEITESAFSLGEGKPSEALLPLDAAIARLEHLPPSTELAAALNNRAAAHSMLGQRDRVAEDFARALAIYRDVLGPEHPDVALLLSNLGNIRLLQGDLDGAEAAQSEALALKERLVGPDHPDVATILINLGALHQRRRDLDRARALVERALSIRERALGPDHPSTANTLGNLGEILTEGGRPAEGRPYLLRALAVREKAEGPEHPMVAALLSRIGRAELALGRPKDARARLERALAIYARAKGMPEELRYTDFYLARARWATARSAKDRAAARALAEAALASIDRAAFAHEADEIEAWLASTRGR